MFWHTWVHTAPGTPDPEQLDLASWWVQSMGTAPSHRRQAWLPLNHTYWHLEWAWLSVNSGSFPRETHALLMTHEFTCENEPHIPGVQYTVWVQSSLVQPFSPWVQASCCDKLQWFSMLGLYWVKAKNSIMAWPANGCFFKWGKQTSHILNACTKPCTSSPGSLIGA